MKYVDEYRDKKHFDALLEAIHKKTTRSWRLMEICGGQTHSIVKYQLDKVLPQSIELIHGPGCPVCVTPIETIDTAIALAANPNVIIASFGDMMRVPGTTDDLLAAKAKFGNVKMLYSPLDALTIAEQNPDKEVIFFAIGFETTAPIHAMTVEAAKAKGLTNFSILSSLFRVPPAIETIFSDEQCQLDGLLAAGHVCSIMGTNEYQHLSRKYNIPISITGFEPVDLLYGILKCIELLEERNACVTNAYARAVLPEGNVKAQELLRKTMETCDQSWRGIGTIAMSGMQLNDDYASWDARKKFGISSETPHLNDACMAGKIMQGLIKPVQCPLFGTRCTPEHPIGASMVSGEGACAAYYRYGQNNLSNL